MMFYHLPVQFLHKNYKSTYFISKDFYSKSLEILKVFFFLNALKWSLLKAVFILSCQLII